MSFPFVTHFPQFFLKIAIVKKLSQGLKYKKETVVSEKYLLVTYDHDKNAQ